MIPVGVVVCCNAWLLAISLVFIQRAVRIVLTFTPLRPAAMYCEASVVHLTFFGCNLSGSASSGTDMLLYCCQKQKNMCFSCLDLLIVICSHLVLNKESFVLRMKNYSDKINSQVIDLYKVEIKLLNI